MSKLLTPVVYEDVLDELNIIRPLKLVDEVRHNLDIPVLDVIPVSKDRPAIGKLLRCDNNGALIKGNTLVYKYWDDVSVLESSPLAFLAVPFARVMLAFYWNPGIVDGMDAIYLTDDDDTVRLQDLSDTDNQWIPFKTDRLNIHVDWNGGVGVFAGVFCGFYN